MISQYASYSASVDYDTILYPNLGNFPCATLEVRWPLWSNQRRNQNSVSDWEKWQLTL